MVKFKPLFKRVKPVCVHREVIKLFNGPVEPVYKCMSCNRVFVGRVPFDENKDGDVHG